VGTYKHKPFPVRQAEQKAKTANLNINEKYYANLNINEKYYASMGKFTRN